MSWVYLQVLTGLVFDFARQEEMETLNRLTFKQFRSAMESILLRSYTGKVITVDKSFDAELDLYAGSYVKNFHS